MPRDPDGRTVLTDPETLNSCNRPVAAAVASGAFHTGYNTIEGMHRQVRKAIKTREHFPDEQAATKLIYFAIRRGETKWRSVLGWTSALRALKIHFADRIPD